MENNQKKDYTTFKDFYNSLGDEPISKEDFEKNFLKPSNDDISIEDIDVATIKQAAKIIHRSFE